MFSSYRTVMFFYSWQCTVVSRYSQRKMHYIVMFILPNGQLKKNYEQKCHEVNMAEEALKRSVSLQSKDEEKVSSSLCK